MYDFAFIGTNSVWKRINLTKCQTLKMYNFCSFFQIHLEFSQDITEYKIF